VIGSVFFVAYEGAQG
jgi:hypothetical protein